MARQVYGKIAEVAAESPAAQAGIRPGDEVVSINGRVVRDVLDYRYLSSDDCLNMEIRRKGRMHALSVRKDAHEDFGLEFEEELFDGVHLCRNNCVFCFLHQMPKGLRPTLYVKDDDYRLSLAHGNYITLTNLTDEDMDRICSQRMSPLYISVHATDPDLRARMFRCEKAALIMDQLRRLARARITMHTQIVLCPGVNDGEHLEHSVHSLSALHPWVASVAVVPVGLTKHREGLMPLKPVDADLAREAVQSCIRWQDEFRERLGTRLVFPSDELYLLSGTELPDAEAYEGFAQLEDGVGISRLFLDEIEEISGRAGSAGIREGRYALATGVLAHPMVQGFADVLNGVSGVSARVCIITNKFLGEPVTVAGLMAGRDIAAALHDTEPDEEILIPEVAVNEDRFLDDMTVSGLGELIRRRVTVVPSSPIRAVERLSAEAGRAVFCTG